MRELFRTVRVRMYSRNAWNWTGLWWHAMKIVRKRKLLRIVRKRTLLSYMIAFVLFVVLVLFVQWLFVRMNRGYFAIRESLSEVHLKTKRQKKRIPNANSNRMLLPYIINPFSLDNNSIESSNYQHLKLALKDLRKHQPSFGIDCGEIIFPSNKTKPSELQHALRIKQVTFADFNASLLADCQNIVFRHYPQSPVEQQHPLAYAILIHSNIEQFLELFRMMVL